MAPALVLILLLIPWPAWSARPLLVAPGDSLVIEGRTLKGGRRGPVVDCRGVLVLRDCILIGRDGRQPLLTVQGGAARLRLERCLVRSVGRPGRRNSLQESDSESDSRAVASTPGPSLPALITLKGGRLDMVSSTLAAAPGQPFLELDAAAGARLNSCLLAGGGGPAPVVAGAGSARAELSWCLTDRLAWAAESPPFRSAVGNQAVADLRFVAPQRGDFRLRWDSPALDAGDPTLPLDFDLTRADVGWQPRQQIADLSGEITTPMPAGHYRIVDDTFIAADIPAGTVLRVDSGRGLLLAPGRDHVLRLGEEGGPRTTIVGRPAVDADPAALIQFLADGHADSRLQVRGLLCNYPAGRGDAHGLWLGDGLGPLAVEVSGDQWSFQHFIGVTDTSRRDPYDGQLLLEACTGRIAGLDVGGPAQAGPGRLVLLECAVDVEDSRFQPTGTQDSAQWSPLLVQGTRGDGTPSLRRCLFRGSSRQEVPLADLRQARLSLDHTRFQECWTTALISTQSTLRMGLNAGNEVSAGPCFLMNQPLLALEGGDLDLDGGRNAFVVSDFSEDWPIIRAMAGAGDRPAARLWRANFWGIACSQPIHDRVFQQIQLLPEWATVADNLRSCDVADATVGSAPPVTPDPAAAGRRAALRTVEAMDPTGSWPAWGERLLRHPDSREATEGTLRLKGLGLHKDYGPEAYALVAGDLFAAADSSEAVPLHQQAVLQVCGGWCVEARWGDREGAKAALNDLLAVETDKVCRDTIAKALLEIDTYPPQGGMSAAGPEAQVERRLTRHQAVHALLSYQRGAATPPQERTEPPASFQLQDPYPNPFNPVTTLVVAVPQEGPVQVRIFNLMGQQVAEPLNQRLPAGLHRVRLDGSRWASGVYVAVAESASGTRAQKLLLIK